MSALDVQHSGRLQKLVALVQKCLAKHTRGKGDSKPIEIAVFCQLPLSIETIKSALIAQYPPLPSLDPSTSSSAILPHPRIVWEVVSPNKNVGMAQASKRQQPKNKARREETAHFRAWIGSLLSDGTQPTTATPPAGTANADAGVAASHRRQICYKYNYKVPEGCQTTNCTDAHVCDARECDNAVHPHSACPSIAAKQAAATPPDCVVKIYALQSLDGYDDLSTSVNAVIFFDLDGIKQSQPTLANHRQRHALSKTYRLGRTRPLEVYELAGC